MFDSEKLANYWLTTAVDDLDSCKELLKSRKYHHALYFGQMYLEKLFKAVTVSTQHKHALPIHNLVELSKRASIEIAEEEKDLLEEISTFNMEARYDNDKFDFYKKTTKEYADIWMKHIERIGLWLQTTYLSNSKIQPLK